MPVFASTTAVKVRASVNVQMVAVVDILVVHVLLALIPPSLLLFNHVSVGLSWTLVSSDVEDPVLSERQRVQRR